MTTEQAHLSEKEIQDNKCVARIRSAETEAIKKAGDTIATAIRESAVALMGSLNLTVGLLHAEPSKEQEMEYADLQKKLCDEVLYPTRK